MDPRNGSDNILTSVYHESNRQGVGVMYRVTDPKMVFEALRGHDINGRSCRLKLTVRDTLIKENNGSLIIHFNNGRAAIVEAGEFDTEVELDIADFSSLIVGAVSFNALLRYGIAQISDHRYADTVDRIFTMPGKPICLAAF
jgi:predicted acetyltransferase